MSKDLIIRLIFDFLFVLIAFLLIYWKSYASEKGKNLATKKDISDITEKIETVKNEIGIHSQRRLEYLKDKKKASLDFLSNISIWLDFTLRPMDRLYNNTLNLEVLRDLLNDLKTKGSNATSTYWNMSVYFDDKTINEVIDDLYQNCIDLHNLTVSFVAELERKAIFRNDYSEKLGKARDEKYAIELNKKIDELDKETQKLVETYMMDKKKPEDEAIKHRLRYIMVLNKILKINKPSP